jgi:hypothetical protein
MALSQTVKPRRDCKDHGGTRILGGPGFLYRIRTATTLVPLRGKQGMITTKPERGGSNEAAKFFDPM